MNYIAACFLPCVLGGWVECRNYRAAVANFAKACNYREGIRSFPTFAQLNFYSSLSFAGFFMSFLFLRARKRLEPTDTRPIANPIHLSSPLLSWFSFHMICVNNKTKFDNNRICEDNSQPLQRREAHADRVHPRKPKDDAAVGR